MKSYIALKAMKFDKSYQKGDRIPENVIAKDMINKLLRCGVLAEGEEIEENLEEQQNQETEQQEIGQQETEQHETGQQETGQQESGQQETGQQESGQQEIEQQKTEQQLLQYKKEELEQMAKQKNIEIKQGMTKTDIVALLLQKE